MWKIITLLVCIFCTNCVEATYNTGIKTRVYEQQALTHVYHHNHHQSFTPTHGHYYQHSGDNNNNDRDYQSSITNHYAQSDNSHQQQQHEGDYYQQNPTTVEQTHHQQTHHQSSQQAPLQPIYERKENSQTQTTGNWQNSENSITQYYTGCPAGHTGQLPYAYDCRRFLNCWHGRGHIQTCSVGTVFNAETLECDRPDKVKCEAALGMLGQHPQQSHGSIKQPYHAKYRAGHYSDITDGSVEVLCPVGAEGLQPHPSDCTRFVNCANGNMHIQQCGPGTAYSISMKVCDFKNKVDCSGRDGGEEDYAPASRQDSQAAAPPSSVSSHTSNTQHEDLPHTADILCLNSITGLFPYPFDYTKFINCKNGNTAIQNCVPDTAFSISKGYCEALNEIDKSDHVMFIVSQVSYEYSQTLITCPPGTEGLHLYPFNAELFVKCIKSQMEVVPCNNAHVFSATQRTCLPHNQVSRNQRVRLLSELQSTNNYRVIEDRYSMKNMIYCPGGVAGNYPNPFDSAKYLKCIRGRLMSESCASGQAFSLSRKLCSLKEEITADDYVPQAKVTYGHEWRVTDMEITHGSIDGLTYLMCPPGLDGYFVHPFDCTKYIVCNQGVTVVNNCMNGAVFSISHKECISREKVEAYDRVEYMTTTKNEFSSDPQGQYNPELGISCNPGTFGIYPHPHDCHKYIRCANGRISVESCASGKVFSLRKSFCHNENEVDNEDRSSYNRGFSVTQNHYEGPVATALNTGSYNPINIPQPSQGSHPAQSIRPPSAELSPPLPSSANTFTTDGVNCPPGATGRYPHPLDCTKFLMCSNGKTHVQDCGPGTAWSQEMEVCDFKEKVGCTQSAATVNTEHFNNQHSKPYGSGVIATQWSHVGIPQTQPNTQTVGNRWTNMNIPRPQGSTYDQTSTWQETANSHPPTKPDLTPVWSGTGVHVDQHNPTHTIIYEEGSFEPNRNYNRPMYNTPLAPLKPTATTVSTTVYAQPVGSQEDSQEIFSNTPTNTYNPQYSHTSNRQNHTRHLSTWTHNRPVDMPRHELMPPHQGQNTVYTNTHVQIPINTHLSPPYQSPQPFPDPDDRTQVQRPVAHLMPPLGGEDTGQHSVSESEFQIGQVSYNLNDFDQLPSSSSRHNINDANNLYGGLQPPLDDFVTTTTVNSFFDSYEQSTQVPPPPKTTTSAHRILGYPQLSNATIQTFPHQPHYSPPYSEVSHSRNVTWVGRKIPQHAAIRPHHINPLNHENTNVKITSTPVPQYYGFNAPPLYSNNDRENDSPASEDPEATMKAALKLLLRPYLDSENKVDDKVAEKAQSHIMTLVSTSDKDTITTVTTHKPLLNHNTLVPSTTPHQEDVELILAGEQHNLLGVATIQTGNHETSTSYNLYQAPLQSERSNSKPSVYTHNHNNNWHKEHHHDPHHFKVHHSHEYHKKHPNLPNPFEEPTNSYNTHAETTTQKSSYDFDIRFGNKCPFECGNGNCVEQHQVCDGVDNCGNRKDEQDCEHLGYELRLTGGQSSNMGRVEVKILGKWGYVCDDKFGLHDADVVCRELGFKMGAMEVRGNSYYAPSDVNVYFSMDEVECKGNETSLKECNFKGWGVNNCGPDEVVGVVCKIPKLKCPDNYWLCNTSKECIPTAFLCDVTPDCTDGSDESEEVCNAPIKYRLEGGRSSHEGRLEVFYHGEWGTVCDDDFSLKEAQVFCNSLSLYGKPEIVKNIYGPGSGPIWLDQVSCLGNETKIDECNHWSWGENNCNHTEDVGIKCTAGPKPNPNKSYKSLTDDSLTQYQDLESTLQLEQSDLDDLGLYQGLWQRSSKAVHSQRKCGHFKSNLLDEYEHPEERVVNGTIAKRGRHPWQATIRTRGRGGISSHWCGAVIISKKLILTAAHCLAGYPKGSYFVRMGDHYANIAESSEVDTNIENWYIHEKFRDQKHMNNDIALILLKTAVRFNDYVQPICLPEKGATLETNRLCTISGWGSIKSGTSTPSNILRSAQVPILADDVCSQKNVYANAMTEGMFCAGFLDESADACDGDSGGPLVCSDEDGETLYGIISWGQHCGYANHPGVYVRVEKYIDWIYEKINVMMQQGKL